jgi:hypothetical protein
MNMRHLLSICGVLLFLAVEPSTASGDPLVSDEGALSRSNSVFVKGDADSNQEFLQTPKKRQLPFTIETLLDGSYEDSSIARFSLLWMWTKLKHMFANQTHQGFDAVMLPKIKADFELYFGVMLRPDFPSPPSGHSDELLINGFKCLHDRLAKIFASSDDDEFKETLQSLELGKTLAFHKIKILQQQIPLVGKDSAAEEFLGKDLDDKGCQKCVDAAYNDMHNYGDHFSGAKVLMNRLANSPVVSASLALTLAVATLLSI